MPRRFITCCPHCRNPLESPSIPLSKTVQCPACARTADLSVALEAFRRSRRARRWVWSTLAAAAVLAGSAFAYRFRTPLGQGFDYLVDQSGSKTAAILSLAVALFITVAVLIWILSPLILFFGLRDLRRRTAELDETTRVCARHLARLTAPPPPEKETLPLQARRDDRQ